MAVIREKRDVHGFDEIELRGVGEIRLVQGDQEDLVIEAEEDVLARIKSEVRAGRLELGPRSWLDLPFIGNARIIFYITVKTIHLAAISGSGKLICDRLLAERMKISVSGSGHIEINHLEAQDLDLRVSGSADTRLGGVVPRVEVHVSGSATLQAGALDSQEVSVRISGAGEMTLKVQQRLDVQISGSGRVQYLGDPQLKQSISGIGQVTKLKAS